MSKKKLKLLRLIPIIELGLVLVFAGVSCLLVKWLAGKYTRSESNNGIRIDALRDTVVMGIAKALIFIIVISCIVITVVCIIERVRRDADVGRLYARTWIISGISVLILLFGCITFNGEWLGGTDPKCFEYTDGQHTMVIKEESWLLGGWGTVYQVEESGKAVVLKGFTTDDGYRNEGNYDIRWSDDSADITFNNGQGGKETITVEFK